MKPTRITVEGKPCTALIEQVSAKLVVRDKQGAVIKTIEVVAHQPPDANVAHEAAVLQLDCWIEDSRGKDKLKVV